MSVTPLASKPAAIGLFIFAALAIGFAGYVDFARLRKDELSPGRDIYALWQDGGRILRGENPYARTLADTSGVNRKYSTYFPLFYVLSAGSRTVLWTYPQFIFFWRVVFFGFYAGIGLMLAAGFYRRQWMIGAMFVLLLWLFNRWTLKTVQLVHIDFLAIAPLLGSLLMLDRRRRTSLLLLGLSLAIKQLAIFVVPLYFVWIWTTPPSQGQRSIRSRLREPLAAAGWIALIPAIVSLPFLLWGPLAFVKSILFSAIRADDFASPAESLDNLLNWPRAFGKGVMLGMMAMVYAASAKKQLRPFAAALLVMTVFAGFNALWFRQYEVWPMALLPLSLIEWRGLDAIANADAKSPRKTSSGRLFISEMPSRRAA